MIIFFTIPYLRVSQTNIIKGLLYDGDYAKVAEILEEKLAKYDSLSKWDYYNLGTAYQRLMNYRNAIINFEIAVKADPENIKFLLALGSCYSTHGDQNSAKIIFKKILSQDPCNRIAMINLGKIYMDLKNYEEAEDIFEHLISIDSLNSYYYAQLGLCEFKTQNLNQAKIHLQKSILLNNVNPKIFLILSRIFFDESEIDKSIEVLEKGIKINPGNRQLVKMEADLFYKKGQYPEAIIKYLSAITMGDTSANTYQKLGISYYYLSFTSSFRDTDTRTLKLQEGVDVLRKAIEKDNKDPISSLYLGLCYKELDSSETSIKYLEESLEKSFPDYLGEIYYNLGICYERENKFIESIKAYKSSIRSKPDKPIVYFHLANLYDRFYKDKSVAALYYQKFIREKIDEDEKLVAYAHSRIDDINEEINFWKR